MKLELTLGEIEDLIEEQTGLDVEVEIVEDEDLDFDVEDEE